MKLTPRERRALDRTGEFLTIFGVTLDRQQIYLVIAALAMAGFIFYKFMWGTP